MSSSLHLGDWCFYRTALLEIPPWDRAAVVFHPFDANVQTVASWWEVILTRLSSTVKTVSEDKEIAAEGCSA